MDWDREIMGAEAYLVELGRRRNRRERRRNEDIPVIAIGLIIVLMTGLIALMTGR